MINKDETINLKPRRVFKCDQENRSMLRKDVWKDAFGRYHCSSCGGVVRDVTNGETGKNLLEIIGV